MKECAIVLNGDVCRDITENFVICADGGLDKINKKPNILIGDFDSCTKDTENIEKLQYNTDKDQTDGELCVDFAIANDFENITFYGVLGGRIDHQLCNFALLSQATKKGAKVLAKERDCNIHFLQEGLFELQTKKNATISIVPFGDSVEFLKSENLKYSLDNLKIEKNHTRGISNVAMDSNIQIETKCGTALLIEILYPKDLYFPI